MKAHTRHSIIASKLGNVEIVWWAGRARDALLILNCYSGVGTLAAIAALAATHLGHKLIFIAGKTSLVTWK